MEPVWARVEHDVSLGREVLFFLNRCQSPSPSILRRSTRIAHRRLCGLQSLRREVLFSLNSTPGSLSIRRSTRIAHRRLCGLQSHCGCRGLEKRNGWWRELPRTQSVNVNGRRCIACLRMTPSSSDANWHSCLLLNKSIVRSPKLVHIRAPWWPNLGPILGSHPLAMVMGWPKFGPIAGHRQGPMVDPPRGQNVEHAFLFCM
jgi:hypothetical protein